MCNYDYGIIWVYAGLSNVYNSNEYYGRTFNSNSPYQINSNYFPTLPVNTTLKTTTFSYQDIIDVSTWTDGNIIKPFLYVVNNTTTPDNRFLGYQFSYTLQPIFDSLA